MPGHSIVITNTELKHLPADSMEDHFEMIVLDLTCNGAAEVLRNANRKLIDFNWIILNLKSSEVSPIQIFPSKCWFD